MDAKIIKEFAERARAQIESVKEVNVELTEEDYDFERACEAIFHM